MSIADTAVKQRLDSLLGKPALFSLKPLVWAVGKLFRRDHSIAPRGRVVFVKMLGGGSLVLALPALLGLRRRRPDLPLDLVTTRAVEPFARLLGVFDRVRVVEDRSWPRFALSSVAAWAGSLGADTVVDLEVYSRLSTLFSLFTCARNRLGFYLNDLFWRKAFNTHLVYFNRSGPAYHFYEQIALWLGASPAAMDECRRHLLERLPPPSRPRGDRVRFIVGHRCSGMGRERELSPAQWKTALSSILPRDKPSEVLFLGVADDGPAAERIIEAAAAASPSTEFVNLCGALDLSASVSLLQTADRYLSIDSSLLHFARLLGVPSTSFWGPTIPASRLKPVPGLQEEVRYRAVPCSPCIHVAETPPCGGRNLCMDALFDEGALEKAGPLFTAWAPHEE